MSDPFMGLARALSAYLRQQIENRETPIVETFEYGGGDSESGFFETYDINFDELEREIDTFIKTFQSNSPESDSAP